MGGMFNSAGLGSNECSLYVAINKKLNSAGLGGAFTRI
jgi:hypothetical protein